MTDHDPATELHGATLIFGETYRTVKGDKSEDSDWEGWEKALAGDQQNFFDALTAHLETTSLARKTVPYEGTIEDGPTVVRAWVARHHPGWRLKSFNATKLKAQIEEDPAFKKHSYVNTDDGYVYGRTISSKSTEVDVERLQEEDPELWKDVSQINPDQWDLVLAAMTHAYESVHNPEPYEVAVQEAEKFFADRDRELKPSSEWTTKQATKIKKYLVPGQISVRLVPPREATEHELETGEAES